MKRFVLGALLISFAIAAVLSHFASESPDGLEKSMTKVGVEEGNPAFSAPFPDYELPVLGSILGKTVPALLGTALAFLLILLLLRALVRREPRASSAERDKNA
jgi:hypothetical protein